MKYWTSHSGYTALHEGTDAKRKLLDLPPGAVVEVMEEHAELKRVTRNGITGWVDSSKLEPYVENFPRDCVDIKEIQTARTDDAEQYIEWSSRPGAPKQRQVNMCGELSICHTLNIGLAQLLERWQAAKPTLWNQIFSGGVARGTNADQLVQIYGLLGVQASKLQLKQYTPGALAKIRGAIVSVRMDKITGRLAASGPLHWVVITEVLQERIGYGLVYIYNPYPSRIEVYSWAEFTASAGAPSGVIKTQQ